MERQHFFLRNAPVPSSLTLYADRFYIKTLVLATTLLGTPITAFAAACSPKNPESFTLFLQRFSLEPTFALKRTIFPLQILRWEYGVNERGEDESAPVISRIAKSEYSGWTLLDTYMRNNGLSSEIESKGKHKAVLKVFKDGTDWQMLYRFKLRNGCWFFWQFEDESL
ncbi:MAG TPA: hypothetical protein VEC35_08250 [Noviherbaspirillum sp.]|nr:hypothetical protein [Noviherbaspirillum sp.]